MCECLEKILWFHDVSQILCHLQFKVMFSKTYCDLPLLNVETNALLCTWMFHWIGQKVKIAFLKNQKLRFISKMNNVKDFINDFCLCSKIMFIILKINDCKKSCHLFWNFIIIKCYFCNKFIFVIDFIVFNTLM